MLVSLRRTVVAPQADTVSQLVVIGGYSSAFSTGAEIFTRIKAEAAGCTECACLSSLILRTVGLTGVFNNRNAITIGDIENRIYVGNLPIKINRNNRGGLLCNHCLKQSGVHRK